MIWMDRVYICIDLKSYYASVECVYRGLDPLQARLLVADETRSDQTICLAVSPALKAIGVPGRPRLFEAKQKIRDYERLHRCKVDYIIAMPRMAEYERISALIYSIYLRYVSAVDIHVYSIDECFLDVTGYLHLYRKQAEKEGTNPARIMATTMIRDVLKTTGITATVGIGTNLYLAKVAMDILAKKATPDQDGVRIAELNEDSYKFLLWDHQPLTDFWQIGPGKSRRLEKAYLHTMGDIAQMSQYNEEFFYKTFGIDGEILLDHAWGIEPVTMEDIKNYKGEKHSLSNGQVLPKPYEYKEARLVIAEMVEVLCTDLFSQRLVTNSCTWWVSYDYKSMEHCPSYDGPVSIDYYGRLHPRHSNGTVKLRTQTNSIKIITEAVLQQFDLKTDHRLLYRRLGVCANDVATDMGAYQLNMFVDYDALDKENRLRGAMQEVRRKYGNTALFRGMNLMKGATTLERMGQIGGHRA